MTIFTTSNTAVLIATTPQSSESAVYGGGDDLMTTAKEHGIRLRWLSFREPFHTDVYNKFQKFKELMPTLKEEGYKYAAILDAPSVRFNRPLDETLAKFNAEILADPQKLTNADGKVWVGTVPVPHVPLDSDAFRKTIGEEGIPLASHMLLGSLDAFNELFTVCIEISREYYAEAPRPGIAAELAREPEFAKEPVKYVNNGQFLLLLAAIYNPELFGTLFSLQENRHEA